MPLYDHLSGKPHLVVRKELTHSLLYLSGDIKNLYDLVASKYLVGFTGSTPAFGTNSISTFFDFGPAQSRIYSFPFFMLSNLVSESGALCWTLKSSTSDNVNVGTFSAC